MTQPSITQPRRGRNHEAAQVKIKTALQQAVSPPSSTPVSTFPTSSAELQAPEEYAETYNDFYDKPAGLSNFDKRSYSGKAKSRKRQDGLKVTLADYSINNETKRLRQEMKEAVFILEGVAIRGQFTAICAPGNGGKTLLTIAGLMKSVQAGIIKGKDVFYINVDDNQRGAIEKTEVVEKLGIHMIVPVLADTEKTGNTPFNFHEIMEDDIENKTVDGKIIIIDTYKKFTNTMDKEAQSKFNELMRRFVTLGGSVIVLTHVNKNRDQEGNLVWGGTSDLIDDCDSGWIIDNTVTPDGITYEFIYKKGRGHSGENIAFFSHATTHGTLEGDQTERYRRRLKGITPQSWTKLKTYVKKLNISIG
ncbi:MAG: hypothetical protein DRP42_04195 [Tenericutes bacterium]|nr:MAG: hypothetical protein DRP42_04195 [Mycoplasmatota bacterium]